MARSLEDTTKWVAGILLDRKVATEAELIGPQLIRVSRPKFAPFLAAIVNSSRVAIHDVQPFVDAGDAEIIANVPKESVWTGDAIRLLEEQPMAFGGIRDLMSASADEDVRTYVRSEYRFVERGLRQHDKVESFDRENERVYVVHRHSMKPLSFVLINEYELTGDHIRTARDRYGAFDTVLLNNPNGTITAGAESVAKAMKVPVFKWGQFLGRLNSP